jgi:hypothetical protein
MKKFAKKIWEGNRLCDEHQEMKHRDERSQLREKPTHQTFHVPSNFSQGK